MISNESDKYRAARRRVPDPRLVVPLFNSPARKGCKCMSCDLPCIGCKRGRPRFRLSQNRQTLRIIGYPYSRLPSPPHPPPSALPLCPHSSAVAYLRVMSVDNLIPVRVARWSAILRTRHVSSSLKICCLETLAERSSLRPKRFKKTATEYMY